MKFKADLLLKTWLSNVEVEGKDEEEVIAKLKDMSIDDMLDSGYEKDIEVSDIDLEVVELTVVAEVTDIEYDLDNTDLPKGFNPAEDLPIEATIIFDTPTDDKDSPKFEEALADALEEELGYPVKSCNVRIINTK